MSLRSALAFLVLSVSSTSGWGADYVSVRGSVVVARVMEMAAVELKAEHNIEFRAVTDGNSSDAIYQLSNEIVDMAIAARMMSAEEKAARPDKRFFETVIGQQAIGVVVSDAVWNSGLHALTKEQLRGIYERDIRNWKEVGGPDREIVFYNRESTHGVWDLYMLYLYGDVRKAPLSKADVIDNPEETKTTVQFNAGAFSLLELASFKEGQGVHLLGLKQGDGSVVEATPANVANGRYEIARPLVLITGKQATGKLREMLEFMVSPKGQAAVKKAGNLAISDLPEQKK